MDWFKFKVRQVYYTKICSPRVNRVNLHLASSSPHTAFSTPTPEKQNHTFEETSSQLGYLGHMTKVLVIRRTMHTKYEKSMLYWSGYRHKIWGKTAD